MAGKKDRHKRMLKSARACHYCGCRLTVDNATLDHVVPLARGGTWALLNLVTCCFEDNQAKADDLPSCHCEQCVHAVLYYLGADQTRDWLDTATRRTSSLPL